MISCNAFIMLGLKPRLRMEGKDCRAEHFKGPESHKLITEVLLVDVPRHPFFENSLEKLQLFDPGIKNTQRMAISQICQSRIIHPPLLKEKR